jgi:putative oxidoreductase
MNSVSSKKSDILLLVVRIILGIIFIGAGWAKITAMAGTIGFFAKIGIPAFLAYVVGYGEFIGGILIVLGLWAEISAIFLSIIMIVAVYVVYPMGMQAVMTPLATLGTLLAVIAAGAGKIAVPSTWFKKNTTTPTPNA